MTLNQALTYQLPAFDEIWCASLGYGVRHRKFKQQRGVGVVFCLLNAHAQAGDVICSKQLLGLIQYIAAGIGAGLDQIQGSA